MARLPWRPPAALLGRSHRLRTIQRVGARNIVTVVDVPRRVEGKERASVP
jgi:hypothetical protein